MKLFRSGFLSGIGARLGSKDSVLRMLRSFFTRIGSFFSWLGSSMVRFVSWIRDFSGETWKNIGFGSGLVLVVLILIGSLSFLLSLQGSEQTMVPQVTGKELSDALIDLQENSLTPFIQKRFSSDPALKGKIVSQDPHGGTLVKAGKRVKLVMSMGAVVDRVGNYVGMDLNDVRAELQTLNASSKPILRIKEPVTYVFSAKPAGTVLEQKPRADTEVSDLTDVVLVVSRGPDTEKVSTGKYTGLGYREAIQVLAGLDTPFTFTMRKAQAGEGAGIVVKQTPEEGTEAQVGSTVQLEMTAPSVPHGYVSGIFEVVLPDYFVMVDLKLETISPAGERNVLLSMKHSGGTLTVPYVELPNTVLVLTVQDREISRQVVTQPM